jgi:hypothetical protein
MLGWTMALTTSAICREVHTIETADLNLFYTSTSQAYLAPHVVNRFQKSMAFHRDLFDYTSDEKVTILLQDFWDYGTGGTTAIPGNRIAINIAPFNYVYETRPANERMNWLMNHELVHVVASDQASGTDNLFRKLFLGKVSVVPDDPVSMLYGYLTTPRWYSPRWYHEGIAVFLETWMAGGLGRALGAYDEMVFRTMIRDGAYIYRAVGLESEGTAADFQVGANSYLYGTRFFSYLALTYGPETLLAWVARTEGSKRYFASQFKEVYGVSLNDEWSRWIEWEHEWQRANLERIRTYPTTAWRPLTDRALGSVSRSCFDEAGGRLYAAVLYPGETAHITAIDLDSGGFERICDVRGAGLYYVTSLAYDGGSQTLFFTTDNSGWRDLVAVDIGSGRTERLIKDVRTGDLVFNRSDRSIWGVRHFNGISTIVRIPFPYKEWNHVYSFPYGNDIFDIDISPDGKLLVGALTDISGMHLQLIMMDTDEIMRGGEDYDVLFDFENSTPANFVFSPDGKYLFGSSYYNGVSNIYRYNLPERDMDLVSNCETGFFRPVPVSADSLIVFRYTGDGFVPCMIANERVERAAAIRYLGQEIADTHPIVKSWKLGRADSTAAGSATDSATGSRGDPEAGSRAAPTGDSTAVETDPHAESSGASRGETRAAFPAVATGSQAGPKAVETGTYRLPPSAELVSMYPIVAGYKDYAAFGLRFDFADKIGLSGLNLSASYSPSEHLPDDERLHLGLDYHYWSWTVTSRYNGADFYDLFGPTKMSRKGYSLGIHYKRGLLWEQPRTLDLGIGLTGYGGLETLPEYQNVASSSDKSLSFVAELSYRNVGATLGAVDYEKGVTWCLTASDDYLNSDHFPQVRADLAYGFRLPIDHSAIWLRASGGHSFGDRDDPFASFYFGGFGNNWVDHLDIKRFREYYSLPGVEINAVGGRNYAKALAEWMLPPLRFRRIGFTSAYLRWARISLFSSGIVTNLDEDMERRELVDVGAQLDLRFITFSLLESTLSVGYGVALERDRRSSDEFMVSLKIL